MSFVSYAQNSEDVLLWRALGKVAAGFYIDVGANDPVEHSVTKAFYDAGWRGINIEPLPGFHALFVEQRSRDINLAVAAGAQEGEIVLFDVPAVNGWASSAPDVAAAHRAEGYEVTEQRVPMRTLNSICQEHVTGDIHFLKIDVEGFEGEVLRGLDLERWRPWILVIEATIPNSRETNFETWEGLVVEHRYTFAYFDGLNRYYVAEEHSELLASLQVQANVFDDAISSHLDQAWRENDALRGQVQSIEHEASTVESRIAGIETSLHQATAALDERFAGTDAALAEVWANALPGLDQRVTGLAERTEQARLECSAEAQAIETRLRDALATFGQHVDERLAAGEALHAERIAAAEQSAARLESALTALDLRFSQRFADTETRLLHTEQHGAERNAALERRLTQSDRRMEPISRRLRETDARLSNAERETAEGRQRLAEAQAAAAALALRAEQAEAHAAALEQQIGAVFDSSSWRITAPARQLGHAARRLDSAVREGRVGSGLRRRAVLLVLGPAHPEATRGLRGWIRRAKDRTWVRKIVLPLLARFPQLRAPLRRIAGIAPIPPVPSGDIVHPDWPGPLPAEYLMMSAAGRKVLLDLARAGQAPSQS